MKPSSALRPAAQATRTLILDTAERLFALHGVEGVSLRQVGTAAGSSNHFAVQYHFGDKSGLVRAIFERRLPSLEVRRAALLSQAKRDDRLGDPAALIEVLLRPLSEETDAEGRCSYAALLLGLHHHGSSLRLEAADLAPLTAHVIALLYATQRQMTVAMARRRLAGAFVLFVDALQALDRERGARRRPSPISQALLADAIGMAAAAFTAPLAPILATKTDGYAQA